MNFWTFFTKLIKKKKKGFKTKNFTKPTAENSTFINGKSFHPKHVYRGIVYSESKRMRRLNEQDNDYQISLQKLREKCTKSEFNKRTIEQTIEVTKKWNKNQEYRCEVLLPNKQKKKKITWATKFKSLIRLNPTEKKLFQNTQIAYARPPTIGSLLINYRKITQATKEIKKGESKQCKKCGLCGNYGNLKNMVWETKKIKTKNEKITLKQNLNCKDNGIYGAKCKICDDFYVGQTVTKFSTRWNGHRKAWDNMSKNNKKIQTKTNESDEQALYLHYIKEHKNMLTDLKLWDAYSVVFLERPPNNDLDMAESSWISKLNAGINLAKTCLPRIR